MGVVCWDCPMGQKCDGTVLLGPCDGTVLWEAGLGPDSHSDKLRPVLNSLTPFSISQAELMIIQ